MASESWAVQQNVKVGNDLINLRADNADEFQAIAEWTIANAALFVQVQQALSSVPPSLAANVSHVSVQEEPQAPAPQQNGGWGAPQQQGPPQFSQPAQAQVAQETITDKWGVRWEYGRPDAPATPRGPAVAKHATSQAGKAYSRWEDPAAGPKWFQERQPKIEKSQQWQGSFINTRG